jgi:hypothetical protein
MSSRITIDALASFCVCFLMMSVKLLLYHAVDQKKIVSLWHCVTINLKFT